MHTPNDQEHGNKTAKTVAIVTISALLIAAAAWWFLARTPQEDTDVDSGAVPVTPSSSTSSDSTQDSAGDSNDNAVITAAQTFSSAAENAAAGGDLAETADNVLGDGLKKTLVRTPDNPFAGLGVDVLSVKTAGDSQTTVNALSGDASTVAYTLTVSNPTDRQGALVIAVDFPPNEAGDASAPVSPMSVSMLQSLTKESANLVKDSIAHHVGDDLVKLQANVSKRVNGGAIPLAPDVPGNKGDLITTSDSVKTKVLNAWDPTPPSSDEIAVMVTTSWLNASTADSSAVGTGSFRVAFHWSAATAQWSPFEVQLISAGDSSNGI